MEKLDAVIQHLKKNVGPDFYGQVVIKIRQGRAVHITEERSIKIDDDRQAYNSWDDDNNQ